MKNYIITAIILIGAILAIAQQHTTSIKSVCQQVILLKDLKPNYGTGGRFFFGSAKGLSEIAEMAWEKKEQTKKDKPDFISVL